MRSCLTCALVCFLWVAFAASQSRAEIGDAKEIDIDFTNAQDAGEKATWSDPDKISVSNGGLGWDGEGAASRDGWIKTKPRAIGLSWRATYGIYVRAAIYPPPREFSLANGQKGISDDGDIYARYSPDLKHWSTWQVLQGSKPESAEEKNAPGRYYSGMIRIPNSERSEYNNLIMKYARLDVPWASDEEAAVRWILARDPAFFSRQIPIMGYVEFLFDGGFRGGQRIQAFKIRVMYDMGGMAAVPKDKSASENRDGPWRYKDPTIEKLEPSAPASKRAADPGPSATR